MKQATLKSLTSKKPSKNDREQAVLLGLVELYLKLGKPIGSQTLQDHGFESLSSATIRNYFSKLEELGFLKQPHTSGGRIPTDRAFRLYADTFQEQGIVEQEQIDLFQKTLHKESQEVATLLHKAAETLSEITQCAVFASSPRFDQDFIQNVKLVSLNEEKMLAILITDFGLVRTETIYLDRPVSESFLPLCEKYFLWRMNKGDKILFEREADTKTAQRIYNEVIVRHVVGYVNFPEEDIFRTGLSKLLNYPEFNDPTALASSLSLLEDPIQMRAMLRSCSQKGKLTSWIGDELDPHIPSGAECAVLAVPYHIHTTISGSIALLGPMRMPYRNLFGLIQLCSEHISELLTKSVYTFKITYRQPTILGSQRIDAEETSIQLENKNQTKDEKP
ncbi:MAG: heat-inducible transcriptional repressor HrcA [Chlamydiales bacterium]|nr:heat-inducible transcriptional repressor HrcA [Chlamydiales bacterium]